MTTMPMKMIVNHQKKTRMFFDCGVKWKIMCLNLCSVTLNKCVKTSVLLLFYLCAIFFIIYCFIGVDVMIFQLKFYSVGYIKIFLCQFCTIHFTFRPVHCTFYSIRLLLHQLFTGIIHASHENDLIFSAITEQ